MRARRLHEIALLPAACGLIAVVLACQPADPVERVQQARSEYTVEAISFYVQEVPVAGAMTDGEAGADTDAAAPADAGAADAEIAPEADVAAAEEIPIETESVLSLDILVSTTAPEPLDGITVELEHVGPDQQPKSSRQIWLDTTGVQKGVSATKTVRIEGIDYTEGDGFNVSIRAPVPAEEIATYREFEGVG
ncbi:MAG: hypothetical protein DWQ36_08570 [Acidobacteria bacterium]|nr:MAG: hypothetical protein DWQ30_22835 [Acidobacteriota bacterium]REK08697.1 MAG: hypothetical protein DWQ36_08570 [Acidobacteriota bacterium]